MSQEGTGENHAVSAMKFGILKQFMDIGYSVLLSDVDIAILQVWNVCGICVGCVWDTWGAWSAVCARCMRCVRYV